MIRDQVPQIENPKRLPLPAAAEAILKQMFATHQRVVIKAELGSGFSGSRVFVVQPIRDTPELPAVIKMAPVALMEKEYRAYREYIRDRLSGAAEIRGEPVLRPGSDWCGLRYHLVGDGIFEIESLYSFCRRASIEDIQSMLKRLLSRMESLWLHTRTSPLFNLRASYDRLLPVNLLIEPTLPPSDAPLHLLRPGDLSGQSLRRGDYVRLEGFVITEVDRVNQALTLNLPTPADAPPDALPVSYRLRLQPVETTSPYQVDDIIDSVEGVVTETRYDLLQTYVQEALGQDFGTAETLTLPGTANVTLPNPLAVLPDVLNEPRHVRVACIHGDLNLENILVDPDARDVHLVDFAMARRDHVLHDLLRIETGVVTWLLPEALAEAGLPPEIVYGLYEQLHYAARSFDHLAAPKQLHPALIKAFDMLATIRKMAREYLFKPGDWDEYYQGLTLYLLGALKFKNLDDMQAPLPKQVAFWGAAAAQKLLREPPPREEDLRQEKSAALYAEAVGFLKAKEWQKALDKWAEVQAIDPDYPDPQEVAATAKKGLRAHKVKVTAIGGAILLVTVIAAVLFVTRALEKGKAPTPTLTITTVAIATGTKQIVPPTPHPTYTPYPTYTPLPTDTPVPPTPTPLPPTDTPTPTQTPVPPTATATHTPRPPTSTPVPTAVPQPAGSIAFTIYLRDTRTETGFAALSGAQPNGGMIYEEGKFVYGEATVQIGDAVYHFDKPEVEPGEPEQLPDPWRVEFEFAEALVARTGNQAGFEPKKAQFWVGTLDSDSAVGGDHPYSLTMQLYEGNELRESIQVFFTVADVAEGGGGESAPGGKPEPD